MKADIGGIENISINKECLNSCRMARQKYDMHLKDKKNKKSIAETRKRKREEQKLKLMRKKQKLTDSLKELENELDDLSD